MSYFHDPDYVDRQFRRLIVKSVQTEGVDGNADGIAKRFRDWGMFFEQKPLYVLLTISLSRLALPPTRKTDRSLLSSRSH